MVVLIYRRDRATAHNLRSVLESEFEQVRAGYRGIAALLALLYRHSLTHHDELRTLRVGGKEIGWTVTSAEDSNHLTMVAEGRATVSASESDTAAAVTEGVDWTSRDQVRLSKLSMAIRDSIRKGATAAAVPPLRFVDFSIRAWRDGLCLRVLAHSTPAGGMRQPAAVKLGDFDADDYRVPIDASLAKSAEIGRRLARLLLPDEV